MNEHNSILIRTGAMTRMEHALLNRISKSEADEWVQKAVARAGSNVVKVIAVPKRMVNFVVR